MPHAANQRALLRITEATQASQDQSAGEPGPMRANPSAERDKMLMAMVRAESSAAEAPRLQAFCKRPSFRGMPRGSAPTRRLVLQFARSLHFCGTRRQGARVGTRRARVARSFLPTTREEAQLVEGRDVRAQRRACSNRGSSRTAAKSSSLRASSRNRGSSSTDRRRWANVSSPVSPASFAKHA
jgi:hypothetical protein